MRWWFSSYQRYCHRKCLIKLGCIQRSGKHLPHKKTVNLNTDKFVYDEPVAVDLSSGRFESRNKIHRVCQLMTGLTLMKKLGNTFVLSHSDLQTTNGRRKTYPAKIATATLSPR